MSTLMQIVGRVAAARDAINDAIVAKGGVGTGGLEDAAAAVETIKTEKAEQYKTETAGTGQKTVYPDTGMVLSYVNINPTPSTEKNVTASTGTVTVDPDSGKLLSRVTVYPTPSEAKSVTAGTSSKTVNPTSGKLMSLVTVDPTPSTAKTVTAPSTGTTVVSPDSGKLLSKVTVSPTPSEERTLTLAATTGTIVPNSGKLMSKVTATVQDSNLVASNIKKGVTILGVPGTLESGGGGGGGIPIVIVNEDAEASQYVVLPSGDYIYPEDDIPFGKSVLYSTGSAGELTIDNAGYSSNCTFYIDGAKAYGGTYKVSNHAMLIFASCLASDTRITMADGKRRMIRDLVAGDRIMSINPNTLEDEVDEVVMADGSVKKTGTIQDVWTFDDGTVVATINPHEFYNVTKGRMMYIADFEIGDRVLKYDRTTPALKEHRVEHGVFRHCTIFTKKNNLYFAAKILTGNRDSLPLRAGMQTV